MKPYTTALYVHLTVDNSETTGAKKSVEVSWDILGEANSNPYHVSRSHGRVRKYRGWAIFNSLTTRAMKVSEVSLERSRRDKFKPI